MYQNSTCALHMLLISLPSEIWADTYCCCMGHIFSQMKQIFTSLYPNGKVLWNKLVLPINQTIFLYTISFSCIQLF